MWNSLSNPTITNCTFSANVTEENGGGMWNSLSNPTLTNCTFTGNSADHGGGMYNLENSSPTLTNCTFSDNSATYSGGMHNCIYCWPTLTSCTFTGNSAAYSAAGMYNADYSSPTLTNCTFSGNSADWSAGGMFNSGNSSPTLTNCTFTANLAQYNGGGMVNMNNSSPTLTNCTFTANSAQDDGGGMVNYSNSSPTLANCTFSGNSAGYFAYGGGMCNSDSNPTITNCIMWADTAYYGSDEIYNDSSTPSISYSDIEGCGGSGAGWDASLGTDGGGNIDADPLFVSASDLHLQDGSPCIDAGINSSVPVGVTADIDGELRIIDGDGDILAIVDMGSDEYLPVQPQVWVDDDYTPGGGNDGHSWGIDAFSVIQTGIGAAGYGSTVYVAAGTYVENITLKNGVKLLGAGPLSTTIDGDASGSVVTSTGCDPNTILT
ncbi:MAG: right-handed parallel beta-helix repeat-containing protein, partial [Planctomycetota bacterium]